MSYLKKFQRITQVAVHRFAFFHLSPYFSFTSFCSPDPPENVTVSENVVNVEEGKAPPRISCNAQAHPGNLIAFKSWFIPHKFNYIYSYASLTLSTLLFRDTKIKNNTKFSSKLSLETFGYQRRALDRASIDVHQRFESNGQRRVYVHRDK
jgi:hypothetical protein